MAINCVFIGIYNRNFSLAIYTVCYSRICLREFSPQWKNRGMLDKKLGFLGTRNWAEKPYLHLPFLAVPCWETLFLRVARPRTTRLSPSPSAKLNRDPTQSIPSVPCLVPEHRGPDDPQAVSVSRFTTL